MTDRYSSLTVVLGKDVRDDDAEYLINAISMLRGVLRVSGNVTDPDNYVAEERAKEYYRNKFRDILWPTIVGK